MSYQLPDSVVWPSSTFDADSEVDSDPGNGAAAAAGDTGSGSLDGAMEAGRFFLAGAAFFAASFAFLLPLLLVASLAFALEVDFFTDAALVAGVGLLLAPEASGAVTGLAVVAVLAAFEAF